MVLSFAIKCPIEWLIINGNAGTGRMVNIFVSVKGIKVPELPVWATKEVLEESFGFNTRISSSAVHERLCSPLPLKC